MRGLQDKVVIVTGAGSGLGRGMAERLAEEGSHVVVFDIDDAGAMETLANIPGGRFEHVDIADYDVCASAVAAVVDEYGRIDALVNNAGWDAAMPFIETDPALWQKIVAINLTGPMNMHHVVLPQMLAQGRGKIVNIASDAGRVGSSGESVYSACKGGVIAFGKTLSRELGRKGININTVCPGPSDTPLFAAFAGEGEAGQKLRDSLARSIPLKRLGTADDIAGMVAFLCSDDADFIIGQTISVSGGLTMHG